MCVEYVMKQCTWRMCRLEHPYPSNFYVSCWQINRSSLPLLLLRGFLFLLSTCLLLASVALPLAPDARFGHWFIYVSNWGLMLMVFTTASSTSVSAYVYFKRPIGTRFNFACFYVNNFMTRLTKIPICKQRLARDSHVYKF